MKYLLIIIYSLFIIPFIIAETVHQDSPEMQYKELWQQVEQAESKGLPQTALEKVDQILYRSKQNQDGPQYVKAVIYRIKLVAEREDDSDLEIFSFLEKEIEDAVFPVKQILHSLLAETYWQYYQQRRWMIFDRTETVEFEHQDIRTWSLSQFVTASADNFLQSLQPVEELSQKKIDCYEIILLPGNTRELRPTLYDFLAHRALDFLLNDEASLLRPVFEFTLDSDEYFSPWQEFAHLQIVTQDTLSLKYKAITILQTLMVRHENDQEKDALIDIDLKRLKLVYNLSINSDKHNLYENALLELQKINRDSAVVAEINYELASFLYEQSNKYQPGEDDRYKFYRKQAYDLCQKTRDQYPESRGAANCEHLLSRLEEKSLMVTTEKINPTGTNWQAFIKFRNISEIYFRIIETSYDEILKKPIEYDQNIKYFLMKNIIAADVIQFPVEEDFNEHSLEIALPPLAAGQYFLLLSADPVFSLEDNAIAASFMTISDLSYIQRRTDDALELNFRHRTSGKSMSDVRVTPWEEYYDYDSRQYSMRRIPQSYFSDKTGKVTIPLPIPAAPEGSLKLEMSYENDVLRTGERFYNYVYGKQDLKEIRTFFFTDRSIYRPGQTVYFKGIILETDGKINRVKTGFRTTVTLFDVNYQKMGEIDLVTSEFGSFHGQFTIPAGVLTGMFHLTNQIGSHFFSVEEYKRPQFEVTLDPLQGSYSVGEKISVTGQAKAYAGYNIDNADLTYKVIRRISLPRWWYFWRSFYRPSTETMITYGTSRTNEEGRFQIEFEAVPDRNFSSGDEPVFTYQIMVDVTDINGETRSGQAHVNIGYTRLRLDLDIPEMVNRDQENHFYMINSTNLNGVYEASQGKIVVHRLKNPDRVLREKRWPQPDINLLSEQEYNQLFPWDRYRNEPGMNFWEIDKEIWRGSFDTEELKGVEFLTLPEWEQGGYRVEINAQDNAGNEVKDIKFFTLFSEKSAEIPYPATYIFTPLQAGGEPGETARFLIGSGYRDTRVLYEIELDGRIVAQEWLHLSSSQQIIEIPLKEEHRGNFAVHFSFVRQNRAYSFSQAVSVPWSNRQLYMEFETFRDKLQPGEKEEWRIKIRGSQGEKVAAELVASLYDASLDAFRPHNWSFNPDTYYSTRLGWYYQGNFTSASTSPVFANWNRYVSPARKEYDSLNLFGMNWYRAFPGRGGTAFFKAEMSDELGSVGDFEGKESPPQENEMPESTTAIQGDKVMEETLPGIEVRTNFDETAFFYPELKTNEDGDFLISFTIPQALTRWKMLGIAHTPDVRHGYITNLLVTQKELMIVPNAPRFFRQGDSMEFTAKITNLSEQDLRGTAILEFYDAITMQPVSREFGVTGISSDDDQDDRTEWVIPEAECLFSTIADQSTLVKWQIKVPENIGAVVYRITARAGNLTDGEEKAIPVLSNRMLVTESLPLPVREKQSKEFRFEKLLASGESASLKHHKLTLEFTSNPAWYAVQALPYMMEYPYECSEQIFTRFYANSIASHIAASDPAIKRVFDQWKSRPGSSALLSNLEKNQELKSIMLEETPWVLNAGDESERKRRIAILFDLNRLTNELQSAQIKLRDAQVSNGGWPWFKGMPESRYITQHIVAGFGHLDKLGIQRVRSDAMVWEMIRKAVLYLDERINDDYQWLLKNSTSLDSDHIYQTQIHYLYARSYFNDIPIKSKNKTAFNYYQGQAQKYWLNKSKYMQGMLALALNRFDDRKTPLDIINSLREYARHSEEMGMYWKDFWLGYYWYEAPIETQALLIEAFTEVAQDLQAVEEMKVWLLKQKQTQDWRTTRATVEACYALLLQGTNLLSNNQLAEITINGKKVDLGQLEDVEIEAGTGYFKTSWNYSEIVPAMGDVQVYNPNNVAAWGSLYWQYFEDLDKITPHQTPLQLSKQVFLEKTTDRGALIEPVTESTNLAIGSRLKVRIELRVDRDMEFVHMKDMRASCLEPENVISSYKWQGGLGYYESTRDASTNFFFDYLPKGTYVFEYALRVTHAGNYSNGITNIQCMYAPEFSAHSSGIRIKTVYK
ncbi:MAG: hypothetical protein JW784_00220 [Candidatus Cloacimonetes bacterium]|nr:hypothetical protein [Candidatus Cloacimonadota bacterium]